LILTLLLVVRGNVRGRIVGVGIVVVLLVSLSLAPMIFWQRLSTVLDTSNILTSEVAASAAESTEDHLAVLNRSIQYTLEYPVFGLGLGNFQVANGTDLARPSAWMGTHNTFTQISSEAGIPALLLFLALLALAMRNMRRASFTPAADASCPEAQLLSRATLASLLSFVFAAFFAHLAYEYYCFYAVAMAVGIQNASQQPAFHPALGPADSKHSSITTEMG
jgi:O-antigen ligase